MVKTFKTDSFNDLVFDPTTNDIAVATDADAYGEIISAAIKTIRGELQLDTQLGIPYFETVFDSVNGIDIWKSEVNKRILAFDFVKGIDSFDASVDYNMRSVKYTITVRTDKGIATVSQ